jgi:hypothetical protein
LVGVGCYVDGHRASRVRWIGSRVDFDAGDDRDVGASCDAICTC